MADLPNLIDADSVTVRESKVNVPLLRKAVEWVEEQDKLTGPDRVWSQHHWTLKTDCGTSYCVAGYITQLMGWEPMFEELGNNASFCSRDEVVGDIRAIAAEELGLSPWETDGLFRSYNKAADIRREAEVLAGEPL